MEPWRRRCIPDYVEGTCRGPGQENGVGVRINQVIVFSYGDRRLHNSSLASGKKERGEQMSDTGSGHDHLDAIINRRDVLILS